MNDLHKAIGDISSIRMQVARSTEFRGYGPATLAATGLFAMAAAAAQAWWLPDPVNHVPAYLAIWITTAIISAGSSHRRCGRAPAASTPEWPTR